jgi:osmotically-inducible protein OsmY
MKDPARTVAQPSDRELQAKVLEALEIDGIDRAAIGVSVSHGVVTLKGRVPSRREVALVEEAVDSTPGVLGIANGLHVEAGCGDDDSLIAEAAVNALAWYRAVTPGVVKVIVADGWITLTGAVADLQERGAAERAVRRLQGVRGVSNALTVTSVPQAVRSVGA